MGTLLVNLTNGVLPIKQHLKGSILTSQYELTQPLKKPTHICYDYKYFINWIFTSQSNLVVDFGTHISLLENCHHQIIYSKFDLKIFYPPLYERTVWHYQQVDTELLKRSLENFDWQNAVLNCTQMSKYLYWLKLIPNETVLANDRDPPWITSKLKSMIQKRNLFYKKYLKPNNQETLQTFFQIQERVRLVIEDSKKKYYKNLSNKLSNDKLNRKCCWTILKRFFKGKKFLAYPLTSWK